VEVNRCQTGHYSNTSRNWETGGQSEKAKPTLYAIFRNLF